MTDKKLIAITVYRGDLEEMRKYRQKRVVIPPKKPGRGRGPGIMESNADLFRRILYDVIESGELE